jgi:hypothetical protein
MDDDEDDADLEADDLEKFRICSGCIGDKFLKSEVESDGEVKKLFLLREGWKDHLNRSLGGFRRHCL